MRVMPSSRSPARPSRSSRPSKPPPRAAASSSRSGSKSEPGADGTAPSASSNNGGLSYAAAGVDIRAGDRMVDLIQSIMRRTHGPRVINRPGGFAGLVRLDYNENLFRRNYKEPVLVACTDGVGTKVKLASRLGVYDTVGIDCVAMCVNDMIVEAGEPLFFLDYLAVNKLVPEVGVQIVRGVTEGCRLAGCALIGGETAEMPDLYPEGEFDIAGFAVGVVELDRAMDSSRVESGDVVIGLPSSGIHSNGYSLVRRIVDNAGLDLSRVFPELDPMRTLGEVLMTPTRIYARSIVRLLQKYTVKKIVTGMAHITGSGIPGNLCRPLAPDMDAVVDPMAWEVPPVFDFLQKHGRVSREEMFDTFNMGIGYALIVRPSFARAIVGHLKRLRESPVVIGRIERGKGEVRFED